jgi:hypothetical protein
MNGRRENSGRGGTSNLRIPGWLFAGSETGINSINLKVSVIVEAEVERGYRRDSINNAVVHLTPIDLDAA